MFEQKVKLFFKLLALSQVARADFYEKGHAWEEIFT